MTSDALNPSSVSAIKQRFQWLTYHNALLAFCIIVIAMRLDTIFMGGGWEDRGQFFGEGELRPNLIDFIYNEVMVNYLILRVIAYKPSAVVLLLIILSAFAYFTRLPITLLFFAVLLSREISNKLKLVILLSVALISFLLLYIRFGNDILIGSNSYIFYVTYPLIGVARLIGTSHEFDVSPLQYICLFFKPIDGILFIVDYVGNYGGELSTGRYVGIDLSNFVYIQSLQGAYNAFGTVLYPFILIAGWVVGPLLFCLFIIFQVVQYTFATQDSGLSRRYVMFLLITGILFSWTSPFAWLVPFLFTKFRRRS